MSVRQAHLIAAFFFIFIGCLFIFYSLPIYESKIGGGGGPGAGVFPFWVGLATAFLGGIYLWQAYENQDHGKFLISSRKQKFVFLKTSSSIVVYLALMPHLGFILASFVLLLYNLKWIAGYRLYFALPFALVAMALISYCFQVLLYISLPRGLISW